MTSAPTSPVAVATATYRYLRLALVVLVVLLAAAVLIEWLQTGRTCLQTSISAYYFTPVRPVLVGVLVAVGVCLVALKGADEREDVLLNVAGMLAPVVAFVPTPDVGECSSIPVVRGDTAAYVENNVGALFVAGALGVLITVAAVLRRRASHSVRRAHVWGTAASVLILLGGAAWFLLDQDGFRGAAHYTAASGLFGLFVVVVWLNARGRANSRRPGGRRGPFLGLRTSYAVVAVVMVLGPVAMYLYSRDHPWAHLLLGVETLLIVAFAVFWLLQTRELGERSDRTPSA